MPRPHRTSLPLARFFAHSPFFPAPWVVGIPLGTVVASVAPLLGVVGRVLLALFAAAMLGSFVLCLLPSRIVVGPDGIEHRWLFWRRFFPLRDVRALERTFLLPARLVLRDGRAPLLPFTFSRRNDFRGDHSAALLAIDRAIAWAAEQPGTEPPEADHLLTRTGEELGAWRRRVAGDGYRSEAVSDETLWRIVDDPGMRADARGAAAALLAPSVDAAGRQRIAEAAATTANTKLRVVLDEAARGAPDEEMARRLDDLSSRTVRDRT